jgi:uncharacterized protein (DUF1800 family)/CTP-dependent riboflavin kinase
MNTRHSRGRHWAAAISICTLLLSACGGGASGSSSSVSESTEAAVEANEPSTGDAVAQATAVTWTKVADEYQTFYISGTQTVRFGSGTSWVEKSVSGYAQCVSKVFGSDPAPGIKKQCEVASGTQTTSTSTATDSGSWTKVADEFQTFYISGTKTVRYGSGSSWVQKSISGYAQCVSKVFGSDPAPGIKKQCQVDSSITATTTTTQPTTSTGETWTKVADEFQTFYISGARTIRFGSGTSWVQKSITGYAQCVKTTFGSDPIPGVKKQCQVLEVTMVDTGSVSTVPVSTAPSIAAAATTRLDATRLANQASFGPTEALVATIQSQGPSAWVASQMKTSGSGYSSGGTSAIHQWTDKTKGFCDGRANCSRDYASAIPLVWDFYRNAMTQPDQLRQRVAYALQQIFVVSQVEINGTYGPRRYHNMILDNSLGNFRNLLRGVTLSPVMGDYLNNANNDAKAPNENFARELLQLFSIGTCRLNSDGTLYGGSCQTTYGNDTVRNYAYALTGWTYPDGGLGAYPAVPEGTPWTFYDGDMKPLVGFHDTQQRQLLSGVMVPAGTTASQALDKVLDSIMAHPNVGPFIGRQLITHLVTSNPSPAYVGRVAQAFNTGKFGSFGNGQKGDMKAVIAAILLDSEARNPNPPASFGKLREPVLHFTGFLRAMGGRTDGEVFHYWWGDVVRQHMFRPPSVFNFYPTDYPVPGTTLEGSTFGIHNANAAIERLNYLNYLLYWNGTAADPNVPNATGTKLDLTSFEADAEDAGKLVDRLSSLVLGTTLPSASRAEIIKAMELYNATWHSSWRNWRVRQAAYLVFGSPEYQIQR